MGRLGKGTYGRLKSDAERTAFLNWVKGDSNIEHKYPTPKADLKTYQVGIVPFGKGGALTAIAAGDRVPVSITGQAWKIHELMNTTFKAILALGKTDAEIGGEAIISFKPARVIVRVGRITDLDAATPTQRTSAVTGRRYQDIKTRTGSIPVGRSVHSSVQQTGATEGTAPTAVQSDYEEVTTALAQNPGFAAANNTWRFLGLSFTPEYYPNPSNNATTYVADVSGTELG